MLGNLINSFCNTYNVKKKSIKLLVIVLHSLFVKPAEKNDTQFSH